MVVAHLLNVNWLRYWELSNQFMYYKKLSCKEAQLGGNLEKLHVQNLQFLTP